MACVALRWFISGIHGIRSSRCYVDPSSSSLSRRRRFSTQPRWRTIKMTIRHNATAVRHTHKICTWHVRAWNGYAIWWGCHTYTHTAIPIWSSPISIQVAIIHFLSGRWIRLFPHSPFLRPWLGFTRKKSFRNGNGSFPGSVPGRRDWSINDNNILFVSSSNSLISLIFC